MRELGFGLKRVLYGISSTVHPTTNLQLTAEEEFYNSVLSSVNIFETTEETIYRKHYVSNFCSCNIIVL